MPVHVRGYLTCKTQNEADLIEMYLPQHAALTKAEPGCLRFEVTQSEDPLIWHVEESFTCQKALEAHQARLAHSVWGQKTSAILRNYTVTRS